MNLLKSIIDFTNDKSNAENRLEIIIRRYINKREIFRGVLIITEIL